MAERRLPKDTDLDSPINFNKAVVDRDLQCLDVFDVLLQDISDELRALVPSSQQDQLRWKPFLQQDILKIPVVCHDTAIVRFRVIPDGFVRGGFSYIDVLHVLDA